MTKDDYFSVFYGPEKKRVYIEFLNIEGEIEESNELYKYIDDIILMLKNDKSYIRCRGFRLICKLAKWDELNIINNNINKLLEVLDEEKPTIVRQCLASLNTLLLYKPELLIEVEKKLRDYNYLRFKDSMSPLIKKDIEYILKDEERFL